jgi:hypothetical protein
MEDEEVWLPAWHFERYEVNRAGGIRHTSNEPLKRNSRVPVSCFEDEDGRKVARLWIGQTVYEKLLDELIQETFAGWDD